MSHALNHGQNIFTDMTNVLIVVCHIFGRRYGIVMIDSDELFVERKRQRTGTADRYQAIAVSIDARSKQQILMLHSNVLRDLAVKFTFHSSVVKIFRNTEA